MDFSIDFWISIPFTFLSSISSMTRASFDCKCSFFVIPVMSTLMWFSFESRIAMGFVLGIVQWFLCALQSDLICIDLHWSNHILLGRNLSRAIHFPTMATKQSETPLWHWLLSMGVSFICFAICTWMLHRDRQKRQQPEYLAVSKYLSISSYLCILLGAITTLFHSVSYVPVLCFVGDIVNAPIEQLHISAMECYQLSRLYYCFSRKQVGSSNGYPNWVFVMLVSLTVFWSGLTLITFNSLIRTECQIASDGTAVIQYAEPFGYDTESVMFTILSTSMVILLFVIESTTATLYWYKICSLRKYQNKKDRAVYDRIQSILHRVLILTFFYFITSGMLTTLSYMRFEYDGYWLYSIIAVLVSYSMFLMQDHNTSEYILFLRFIKRYKCIWCFCCFGSMVNEQYRMLADNVEQRTSEQEQSAQTENTRNASADVEYGINANGMELSVATKTVCVASNSWRIAFSFLLKARSCIWIVKKMIVATRFLFPFTKFKVIIDRRVSVLLQAAKTMATSQFETPLLLWLIPTGISFICFVICVYILLREKRKRQQPDHITVSKHLSISSYLCIAHGSINTLLQTVSYLPGLCLISDVLDALLIYTQISAMEYYQLSRLYYCFSRKQVHSNNGYPNWVFVVLLSLMVSSYLFVTITNYSLLTMGCQIARDGSAVTEYRELFLYDDRSYILILLINGTVYNIIEIATVALYWFKIYSLQRHRNEKDRAVYDRIQSILHRVLILTFLYYICGFVLVMLRQVGVMIVMDTETVATLARCTPCSCGISPKDCIPRTWLKCAEFLVFQVSTHFSFLKSLGQWDHGNVRKAHMSHIGDRNGRIGHQPAICHRMDAGEHRQNPHFRHRNRPQILCVLPSETSTTSHRIDYRRRRVQQSQPEMEFTCTPNENASWSFPMGLSIESCTVVDLLH